MQWLIDLIAEKIMGNFQGMIVMWSGTLDDVPDGWQLCNGDNGSPDLEYRFIRVANPIRLPHTTGGYLSHRHTVIDPGHNHELNSGSHFGPGAVYDNETKMEDTGITLGYFDSRPPFYTLAFIMKL